MHRGQEPHRGVQPGAEHETSTPSHGCFTAPLHVVPSLQAAHLHVLQTTSCEVFSRLHTWISAIPCPADVLATGAVERRRSDHLCVALNLAELIPVRCASHVSKLMRTGLLCRPHSWTVFTVYSAAALVGQTARAGLMACCQMRTHLFRAAARMHDQPTGSFQM